MGSVNYLILFNILFIYFFLSDMESCSEFQDAKFIVFESALRELFDNCPVCKKHCIVDQHICGTLVVYTQNCPHCSFTRKWQSQPMKGKIPQGNLELSAAVYLSGGSYKRMERVSFINKT